MKKDNLISASDFCINHSIEVSFVGSLRDYGLIEITTIENEWYIAGSEMRKLEKIVRLYYDLEVNLEGIETITHLLIRVEKMQNEIQRLENRLRFYEENARR